MTSSKIGRAVWCVLLLTVPEKVDLRPQFAKWKLPPKAQGARNTCSVFVTVRGTKGSYIDRNPYPLIL